MIEAVGDNMKTDMTFDEMKSLLTYVKEGMPQVETLSLGGQDDNSTGVWYWQLDEESLEDTKNVLKEHLELNQDEGER